MPRACGGKAATGRVGRGRSPRKARGSGGGAPENFLGSAPFKFAEHITTPFIFLQLFRQLIAIPLRLFRIWTAQEWLNEILGQTANKHQTQNTSYLKNGGVGFRFDWYGNCASFTVQGGLRNSLKPNTFENGDSSHNIL